MCCIWCLSHYTLYTYTHSDKNCYCVVLTKIMSVLHLFCKLLALKGITSQCAVIIQWFERKTTSILQFHIMSTNFLWGVHVLSSSNTDAVDNSIMYNLSRNMERYCLDAKYASGALLMEVIHYSNYVREKWNGSVLALVMIIQLCKLWVLKPSAMAWSCYNTWVFLSKNRTF